MKPLLFTPLTLRSVTLRNRIAIPPMCMYSAMNGYANDFHLVHYGARAIGGAGLIIQEATAVSPGGRITPGDLGLWEDGQVDQLRQITRFIKGQGAVPGIQLAHAGRKAGCTRPWEGGKQLNRQSPDGSGWHRLAPSAIGFNPEDEAPNAMTLNDIAEFIRQFASSAKRAIEAGYEVMEIHAAHGYLLHEFMSPLSNHRTDEYGGSFENRTRLIMEVVETIRGIWPADLPLFVRLSATDWIEGGWNPEETVRLAILLKNKGVDLIDTSSAGSSPLAKIPAGPGFQVPFAERIRREAGIPTGAVGLITAPEMAEEILQNGQADLILIGRESLRDPNFPLHAARILQAEIPWPNQYLRARRTNPA